MHEARKTHGYIKLTTKAFRLLHFHHFSSTTDQDLLRELQSDGINAQFAGSAILVSDSSAPVSVNFAWYLNANTKHLHLVPGFVGTNLMLVDTDGKSMGSSRTSKYLLKWIKSTKWKRNARMLIHADPQTDLRIAGELNRKWRNDYLSRQASIDNADDLFSLILSKARDLGFEFASYGIKAPVPLATQAFMVFSNYPDAWRERYAAAGYVKIDPTVRHAILCNAPILWSDEAFKDAPEFWAEAQSYGLRYGWAKGARDGTGMIGLLSLSRSKPKISQEDLDMYQDRMIWLAEEAHAGMSRLLAKKLVPALASELIEKEKEVLRWTGEGKTAGEIAQITGESERNINFHITNAVEKLFATNKAQAVVKATLLGLLS